MHRQGDHLTQCGDGNNYILSRHWGSFYSVWGENNSKDQRIQTWYAAYGCKAYFLKNQKRRHTKYICNCVIKCEKQLCVCCQMGDEGCDIYLCIFCPSHIATHKCWIITRRCLFIFSKNRRRKLCTLGVFKKFNVW